MATPTAAASAYASLARLTDPAGLSRSLGEAAGGGPSFGQLVKDAMGALTQAGRNSETQAQAMVVGKANLVDVVTAVSETEVAVDALVSVRDKVISAYEEIMRMPI